MLTPLKSIKGSQIRPDRCTIQLARLHKARQVRCCIGFPLDVTYEPDGKSGTSDPDFKARVPGT